MPRFLVVIRKTTEFTREFSAKDEDSAIEKAQEMFEKKPENFDESDVDYEYETEEP